MGVKSSSIMLENKSIKILLENEEIYSEVKSLRYWQALVKRLSR